MLELTYFGNATFSVSSGETTVLIDPFITDSDECPYDLEEVVDIVDGIDAMCITHLGYDHIGDALPLALEYEVPVVTEPGTMQYLRKHGVPEAQITKLSTGMKALVGDLTVRALEARHVSTTVVDDALVTGEPVSYLVTDGDDTVYHLGDTSIFSDLELFGDLYQPDVALLGVGQAHSEADEEGPVTRVLHELTTDEAVQVARWLGSDRVVPMHYLPPERAAFLEAMDEADDVPEPIPLDAGETLTV